MNRAEEYVLQQFFRAVSSTKKAGIGDRAYQTVDSLRKDFRRNTGIAEDKCMERHSGREKARVGILLFRTELIFGESRYMYAHAAGPDHETGIGAE